MLLAVDYRPVNSGVGRLRLLSHILNLATLKWEMNICSLGITRMTTEERLLRLENAFATLSEIAGQSNNRIDLLIELARSSEERMDQHLAWINQLGEAQANSEARIAALADAQIKTDAALTRLAEAQAHTDQGLDALIDIVRELRNGKS